MALMFRALSNQSSSSYFSSKIGHQLVVQKHVRWRLKMCKDYRCLTKYIFALLLEYDERYTLAILRLVLLCWVVELTHSNRY